MSSIVCIDEEPQGLCCVSCFILKHQCHVPSRPVPSLPPSPVPTLMVLDCGYSSEVSLPVDVS